MLFNLCSGTTGFIHPTIRTRNRATNRNISSLFIYIVFVYSILVVSSSNLVVNAACHFEGREYNELSNWRSECSNCTCVESIPFCEQIQCKYEPCEQGKQLILNDDECCPVCEEPRKSCNYDGYLINHNTEFTPKLCTTCRCKNGIIECSDSCTNEGEDESLLFASSLLATSSSNDIDTEIDESSSVRIIHMSAGSSSSSHHQQQRQLKTRTNQNEATIKANHRNRINNDVISQPALKGVCFHDGKLRQYNSTWSPVKCTQCRCALNSVVDCYVFECPLLNCSTGYEIDPNECCPRCREEKKSCQDTNGLIRKNGDYWTKKDQPCVHCTCSNGQINCIRENCTQVTCARNEILVTKSHRCCPRCESQMSENCEYFGRIHYNGEMWYTQGCQHCACNSGRVICMNVQCQSQFCLRDEIMVRKKDECCISCRKPAVCRLDHDNKTLIKENEVWISNSPEDRQKQSSNSCKICKCLESGRIECFTKSCINARYPSYARLNIVRPESSPSTVGSVSTASPSHALKEISARTIPFLADFIKTMRKESIVLVASGPKLASSSLILVQDAQQQLQASGKKQASISQFSMRDLVLSRLFYQYEVNEEEEDEKIEGESDDSEEDAIAIKSDFVQLLFISPDNHTVHSVLIEFEIGNTLIYNTALGQIKTSAAKGKDDSLLSRSVKGVSNSEQNKRSKQSARKTIVLHPGEAIKLTSAELKPKKSLAVNSDKLVYFLVSGAPKYGDLKLKKVLPLESVALETQLQQQGWSKVNDIYLEKSGVREFTQLDLDNGNVWYEPYNDLDSISSTSSSSSSSQTIYESKKQPCRNRTDLSDDDEYEYNGVLLTGNFCDEENQQQPDETSLYRDSNSINEGNQQAKYDHCMFEVYSQDKFDELISKEIIHFSIQREIINETVLGLEVIENQITPLTFSNFDIAGIDITREYLIYKIIKSLEKDQGQLEHANRPGVSVQTFTQHDLNAGHILYYSPKEIGAAPREFFFTFIVTNDNRSDTFPETPFHIKCLPSNDQAPVFVHVAAQLTLQHGSSLVLARDLFDVVDPDTQLDNLVFTLERAPALCVIEMRSSRTSQRHLLSAGDVFTIHEVRDSTFRIVHSAGDESNNNYQDEDSFTLAVSDQKHVAVKTVSIEIKRTDRQAPRVANKTTMLLTIREGQQKTLRRENLAFVDDRSPAEQITLKLVSGRPKTSGRLYLRERLLGPGDVQSFTQADIDLQNVRYEAPAEIGPNTLTESVYFDVSDKDGNTIREQLFTIKVEPVDNQAPIVELVQQPVRVLEGGYLLLNESLITVRDVDSSKEQLNVIIDAQPSFGYIENLQKGVHLSSFSVNNLIDGLTIRYVQSDHKNKEPNHDSFMFHVSDGINESPTYKLLIDIEPINDEQPVAVFEPLQVELNKRTPITNATFFVVDFDSRAEDLDVTVEEFPKHGRLFLGSESQPLTATTRTKFSYSDVLDQLVFYRLDDKHAQQDEIRVRISDGLHSVVSKYVINRVVSYKSQPVVEKNEGLQAISGHMFQITDNMLRYRKSKPPQTSKEINSNNKLGGSGSNSLLSNNNDDVNDESEAIFYHVITSPAFGKLQYRYEGFFDEISSSHSNSYLNSFTQKDIDEGRVFYNHGNNEPTGVTSMGFNVSDFDGNVLGDQRFIISVRGDKLPPVVVLNKGIKVNQGQSTVLSRFELDIRDDDTQLSNIKFFIVTQPKLGRLENTKEPGKRIESFTYNDLTSQRIKYIHTETSTPIQTFYGSSSSSPLSSMKDDRIDLKITDGKNEASASVPIAIIRSDNQMPTLISTYSMRVAELERRRIGILELKIVDPDTSDDQLKVIITHPPQYGTIDREVRNSSSSASKKDQPNIDDKVISIDTSTNQKLNFILKFNNAGLNNKSNVADYVTVNEFTMADIKNGLISYKHRSPGTKQDRFGFVIYDGFNNMFVIDSGLQVSNYQIFNIDIGMEQNQAPVVEKNLGLDYLYQIDGQPGRLITKNELQIADKDTSDSELTIDVVRKPAYGSLEHKDRPGTPLFRFTQQDINANKIYYLLRHLDDKMGVYEDYFEFDVHDSTSSEPRIKKNRFDIRWSFVNIEESELSVMEAEGKARVHVKKTGYLKQFSMVSCRTQSHTAKSNRDTKQYDFVHTHTRLEFNEDESYKACDIVLNKDDQIEPIESFWVQLDEAKYSIIGLNSRIKVNILDKKRESIVEFEQAQVEVQENGKFVSLAVVRSGDLSQDVWVECLTRDESAHANTDYMPRSSMPYQHQQLLPVSVNGNHQSAMVKIPAGETYGFCDIEIVDDDVYELGSETFRAVLSNPSFGARLGARSEATIVISGPNDIFINDCNTLYHTVNDQSNKVAIEVTRENGVAVNETLEILVENIVTSEVYLKNFLISIGESRGDLINKPGSSSNQLYDDYNSISVSNRQLQFGAYSGKNVSVAIPNVDFEPLKKVIKFMPGEINKKFYINILPESNRQSDNLKIFTVQLKPINPTATTRIGNLSQCSYINPDFVNIVIEQSLDKNTVVGFNQTSAIFVNETTRYLNLPIVRHGDLSKPFSVMCYTRGQTASEGKDFMPRASFEQSRIYFESGEKVKNCTIEIVNDSTFEADETFQVKLSDLRTPAASSSNIRFNQFTTVTVTILNEEDASVISLSEETYHTEEPSSPDSSVVKPITIVRSGDLSRTTLVRISTSDDTAQAGLDYKPKTETIKFAPGVSALDFDIEIFHDEEREGLETFRVLLGPQDPVAGVYGRYKSANVIIRDSSMQESDRSGGRLREKGDSSVYIDSLVYFVDRNGSLGAEQRTDKRMVPNGEPLICLEPCDVRNPQYSSNLAKCSSPKSANSHRVVQYSWEISTPNEFGIYSSYTKLGENSLFSQVNESILESIYFQPKFRVRCVIHDSTASKHSQPQPIKSNYVEVIDDNPIYLKHRCLDNWRLKTQDAAAQNGASSSSLNYDQFSAASSLAYYYSDPIPIPSQPSSSSTSSGHNQLLRFSEKPFLARADYISADYIKNNPNEVELDFLNYVRLEIEVPYLDGTLPLISTQPLQEAQNLRHLLSANDSASTSGLRRNHVCSNFLVNHGLLKYGFLKYDKDSLENNDEYTKSSKWSQQLTDEINSHRSPKTLSFYSSLDSNHCLWHFVAYYDITELTTHCAAQLISSELDSSSSSQSSSTVEESDNNNNTNNKDEENDNDNENENDDEKSYLIIKIPLYVSYLYAGHQGAWNSLDYKSSVEASIIYKTRSLYAPTKSDDSRVNLNDLISNSNSGVLSDSNFNNGVYDTVEKNDYLVSLTVSKISMTETGKLVIEFSTVPAFHGQFVKFHPSLANQESRFVPPSGLSNVEFNLELVWSQYTYDYPEQTWKATSNSVINNYSGNYTIVLIPCYAKQEQAFKYPFDCEPREAINYTIPIVVEQSIIPVALKYTLGTKFTLSPSPRIMQSFDGYFRRSSNDQSTTAYGTVSWNGGEAKDYNLTLTKVYICASGADYAPLYDPDGLLYNRGPQFGCARDSHSLRARYLLLSRESNEPTNNSIGAEFLDTSRHHPISEGFKFNTSSLFDVLSGGEDATWYVHVFYLIRPTNNNKKNVFNNGTNMQVMRLTSSRPTSSLFSGKVKAVANNRNRPPPPLTRYKDQSSNRGIAHAAQPYSGYFVRIVMPILVSLAFVMFVLLSVIYWKREQIHQFLFVGTGGRSKSRRDKANQAMNARSLDLLNYAKSKLRMDVPGVEQEGQRPDEHENSNVVVGDQTADHENDAINTSENNYSGSNSTSDTMVVVVNTQQATNRNAKDTTGAAEQTFNTIVNNSGLSSTLSNANPNNKGQARRSAKQRINEESNYGELSSGREDMFNDEDDDDDDEDGDDGFERKKSGSLSLRSLLKRVSNMTRSKRQQRRVNNKNKQSNIDLSTGYDNDETTKRFLDTVEQQQQQQQTNLSHYSHHHQINPDDSYYHHPHQQHYAHHQQQQQQRSNNFPTTSHGYRSPTHHVMTSNMSPHHFSTSTSTSTTPNTLTMSNNRTVSRQLQHQPQQHPNNYLYFNYNNNKMTNYFSQQQQQQVASPIEYSSDLTDHDALHTSEILMQSHHGHGHNKLVVIAAAAVASSPVNTAETIAAISSLSSSTPTQITPVSSTTNCGEHVKRLSGTEV